jgi:hypothetical protein
MKTMTTLIAVLMLTGCSAKRIALPEPSCDAPASDAAYEASFQLVECETDAECIQACLDAGGDNDVCQEVM